MTISVSEPRPLTQAPRRARSRGALLEAAARGLSRYGYGNLVLDQVASEAGYTRGALYHQFASKEELAIAVVAWVEETWYAEVAPLIGEAGDPVEALIAVARGHAVYCRRDIARVMMTLRVEFSDQDHPVGRAVNDAVDRALNLAIDVISAARATGRIPAGPPARVLALAYLGAVEGVVISLAGQAPFDEVLAERVVRGLFALPPNSLSETS